MVTDKSFKIAFIFSIGLHSILFSPLLSFLNSPHKVNNTLIEVTYIKIQEEKPLYTKPMPLEDKKVSLKEEKKVALKDENTLKDIKSQDREIIKKDENKKELLQKKPIDKIHLSKSIIDLNSVSLKEGTSDSLNYLRAVRNKINSFVHRNYESSMGEGEVLLHFVLNSDGTIQTASIIRDNLGNNKRLRSLCLDSIYHSSPFNSFPKDLDLPHAAFNICISFKR